MAKRLTEDHLEDLGRWYASTTPMSSVHISREDMDALLDEIQAGRRLADIAEEFLKDFCNNKPCRPGALQRALAEFRAEGGHD